MVMLIDDDRDDCDIFVDAVHDVTPCKCHCFTDPVKALALLNRCRHYPTCIFLDINIPVINGIAILRTLKADQRLAQIPVIMYSTTSNENEIKSCLTIGADRFIRKTASYAHLVHSLSEVKEFVNNARRLN